MGNVEIMPPDPGEITQAVFDRICDRMAEGESLRQICKDPSMPARTTFLRWVGKEVERERQYQGARDALHDWIAEEIIRIADDSAGDYFLEDRDGKSVVVPDHARVQRARLQVDSRKWILSKLAPRKYGDKVELLTAATSEQPGQNGNAVQFSFGPTVHLVVYPMLDAAGNMLRPDTPEYDAAIEQATKEVRAQWQGSDGPRITSVETHQTVKGEITTITAEVGIPLREEAPQPPAQLTFQPDPLPGDLSPEDWSLLTEVLNLIKRTIPTGDNSPPDVIFRILRQALLLHFREVEIEATA